MKTNFFINCKSIEEVKKLYKDLALKFHPDREGGDLVTMQNINAEYQAISKNKSFDFQTATEGQQTDFIKYPEILDLLMGLDGLIIEIIGSWLWISGNTYAHRAKLKEMKLFFAPKKSMWYYRPSDFKSLNKKPIDIDEIRRKYGSDTVQVKDNERKLKAA